MGHVITCGPICLKYKEEWNLASFPKLIHTGFLYNHLYSSDYQARIQMSVLQGRSLSADVGHKFNFWIIQYHSAYILV